MAVRADDIALRNLGQYPWDPASPHHSCDPTFIRAETIGIVLNVGEAHAEEFERGFRAMEAPIWQDLNARGLLVMATLTRLNISTKKIAGAVQYLVVAIFATDEGHHVHDHDPRFGAWNQQANSYQSEEPFVFGGDTIVHVGP